MLEITPKSIPTQIATAPVGVGKGFLKVLHGLTGTEGIARIGFFLHGAVPMLPDHDTIYADNQDTWLSRYMLDRAVLQRPVGHQGLYHLGSKPEAAFPKISAVQEARQLGILMGMLSTAHDTSGASLLNNDGMILLATCAQSRDAACALAAELKIFASWFDRHVRRIAVCDFASAVSVHEALRGLVKAPEYAAVHSARLKFEGYRLGRPQQIVDSCAEYLRTLEHGNILSAQWRGDWIPVLEGDSEEQRNRFDPWIAEIGEEVFVAALGIFTIELALSSALVLTSKKKSARRGFEKTCGKIVSYIEALDSFFELTIY